MSKTITVTIDTASAMHAAEHLRHTNEPICHHVAEALISVIRPGPDSINLDGRFDSRTNSIRYLGIARRQENGLYHVLADVGGALCTVEVSLVFDPAAERTLPAVKIGTDVPTPTALERAAGFYAQACDRSHAASLACGDCDDDEYCEVHAPLAEETRRARMKLLDAAREMKRTP